MATEIVKVQRPIVTNDPDVPWLMYDRARKHEVMVPDRFVPQDVKEMMGDDYKAYFHGAWSSIVGWGLGPRAEDQPW